MQGVVKTYDELQEVVKKLQDMCLARYEAGARSQQYNQFWDICNKVGVPTHWKVVLSESIGKKPIV